MAEQLGSLEKVLRFGEGRRVKRLSQQAAYIGTLEPEFEKLSDAELAGHDLSDAERSALLAGDIRRLYDLGANPYLIRRVFRPRFPI